MNEPTVEQLQAQVDALVAELAHQQEYKQRLQEAILDVFSQFDFVIVPIRRGYDNSSIQMKVDGEKHTWIASEDSFAGAIVGLYRAWHGE